MEYTIDRLEKEGARLLSQTGLLSPEEVAWTEPRPNIPADLALPLFSLARSRKLDPAALAQQLASAAIPPDSLVGAIEATGPFVNLSVSPARFAREVLQEVLQLGDSYGHHDLGAGQTVIIDFSSPNVARKMHVGHLRSTVIGNAIRNLLSALGYRVIADNHLGDWGTQFGSLLAAHALWGWPPEMEKDPIEALVQIYARFHNAAHEEEEALKKAARTLEDAQKAISSGQPCDASEVERAWSLLEKQGPTLKDLAREHFLRLERGEPAARATWKWLVDLTLREFSRTYARLGVRFDITRGESFYEPMLAGVVQEAIDKGVARVEPDGAVSVSFDDKLPSYLLRRRDGATLYQTRDVATCLHRLREYAPARNIYVVGKEQELHFRQVFETVRRMGYEEIAARSVHISFGSVTDAQGQRFSMRRGTAIFLDEVLDEAESRARAIIREKVAEGKTELGPEEVEEVSRAVGIGAVIYNDLYQGPSRNIRFDWDTMLSFEGNSAPYLQFNHARCRSILRKAKDLPERADYSLLVAPEEQAVIKRLARLPRTIRQAGESFLPSLLAEALYQLARDFSAFYRDHSVLDAPSPELRAARLGLVQAVAQGLKNGLTLLGISAPERM